MIQKPIPGSVDAGILPESGSVIPGYSVYRFEFTYSSTSSRIYFDQGFGLDAYVSVGQYEPDLRNDNKYDRRLAIRSFEELEYAFATAGPDGALLTEAERMEDERRARLGDTVYILDDIIIPAGKEICLTYPVNLYLYGNMGFEDNTARFNIKIDPALSSDIPYTMDIGEENGDGMFLFPAASDGGNDYSVIDTVSVPDFVTLNWFAGVTGDLVPGVNATPGSQPLRTFPVANFSAPSFRRIDGSPMPYAEP